METTTEQHYTTSIGRFLDSIEAANERKIERWQAAQAVKHFEKLGLIKRSAEVIKRNK